jgi:tRNA A37 methylthiotransferase MiaB
VVRERLRQLVELAARQAGEWAGRFVGRTERVLFEEVAPGGRLSGYTDRYVRLTARGPRECLGVVHEVLCTGRQGRSLVAEFLVREHASGCPACMSGV